MCNWAPKKDFESLRTLICSLFLPPDRTGMDGDLWAFGGLETNGGTEKEAHYNALDEMKARPQALICSGWDPGGKKAFGMEAWGH